MAANCRIKSGQEIGKIVEGSGWNLTSGIIFCMNARMELRNT